MSRESDSMQSLEQWLTDEAQHVLRAPSPDEGHLELDALIAIAAGRSLDTAEKEHLLACEECRAVLGALLRSPPHDRAQRWLRRILAPRAIAVAAVAAALLIAIDLSPPTEFASRGGAAARFEAASVTVLRDDPGARRVLVDGDALPLGARLGFRYGNPAGEAKTVTILAWDGHKLHWYYPQEPDGAPHRLKRAAVAERLPFDVLLDGAHRAGPLHLWIGLDVPPTELAAAAKANAAVPKGARRLTVRLRGAAP